MPTTPNTRPFTAFRITTATEELTYFRSRTSAYSEAAIEDGTRRAAAVGCSFEIGEPAVIRWAVGGGWTGGLVIDVGQIVEIDSDNAPRM